MDDGISELKIHQKYQDKRGKKIEEDIKGMGERLAKIESRQEELFQRKGNIDMLISLAKWLGLSGVLLFLKQFLDKS